MSVYHAGVRLRHHKTPVSVRAQRVKGTAPKQKIQVINTHMKKTGIHRNHYNENQMSTFINKSIKRTYHAIA